MAQKFAVVLFLINFVDLISLSFQSTPAISNLKYFYDNESQLALKINISDDGYTFFEEYNIGGECTKQINLCINKTDTFGYLIFQIHSFAYNIKLYADASLRKGAQVGRNLGLVLFENKQLYINNPNKFDVSYVIAIITYNTSSPVAGGCNLEGEIPELPTLKMTSLKDLIQVDTPSAAMSIKQDPEQKLCSNQSELNYVGVYHFLPKRNFSKEAYFFGIKKFLLPSNITKIGTEAFKKNNKGPANRRVYMKIQGTGMVFITIVRNSDGIAAAYVPAVTYFCNPFDWIEGCNMIFDDKVLKTLSTILIVAGFIKTFTFLDSLTIYIDLLINCFSIGAYWSYLSIKDFNYTKDIKVAYILGGGLLTAIVALLFYFYLVSDLNTYLREIIYLHLTSVILFSWLFTLNAVYIFEGNDFKYGGYLYWIIYTSIIFCCLLLIIIRPLRILWLILNVIIGGYYLLLGLQFFTKSNLVYIPLNHFYKMQNPDYKYANGYPPHSKIDIVIIIGTLGAILIGIIIRQNKICLFQRRREHPEEQPLLRSSINGSDEVFESPNTSRFFRKFSQNMHWR